MKATSRQLEYPQGIPAQGEVHWTKRTTKQEKYPPLYNKEPPTHMVPTAAANMEPTLSSTMTHIQHNSGSPATTFLSRYKKQPGGSPEPQKQDNRTEQ